MQSLFEKQRSSSIPILLVDTSGSVINCKFNNALVFDKMLDAINKFGETDYYVIFWNSANINNKYFKSGIYKLPTSVKKNAISQAFQFLKLDVSSNFGGTYPHLGLDAIEKAWIVPNAQTKIYYITDGEVDDNDKVALQKSIKTLFDNYNGIQLNIVTVEAVHRDFNQVETLQRSAGCDVYKIIMTGQLTRFVSKFISYTPNNLDGFIHIDKVVSPAGFIPFGDKYFSELRMNDFIRYLMELIRDTTDENELLKIVQKLSTTISVAIKDKPRDIGNRIINMFCSMFSRTTLDQQFVKFILDDAIKNEQSGTANVFAHYRAQLKDLFKKANELLEKNVRDALGIQNNFLTLSMDGKIIHGNSRYIDQNLTLFNKVYPESAISINGVLVPVMPFNSLSANSANISEQCLRQWIRLIISEIYGVDKMGDIVIYVVLGLMLQVVNTPGIDERVKDGYRYLGKIMLLKKRLNTDITELARLQDGELPTPNSGKIGDFLDYMNSVARILEIQGVKPMTLWYAMCLASGDEALVKKQLAHCADDIKADFPGINPRDLLGSLVMRPLVVYKLPDDTALDYRCLITLEDVSDVGGFKFLEHTSVTGSRCCPIYVLSAEGFAQMMSRPASSSCPICYAPLTENNFAQVEKKPALDVNIFDEKTARIFKYRGQSVQSVQSVQSQSQEQPTQNNNNQNNNRNNKNKNQVVGSAIRNRNGKCGYLIVMNGTIGSGKSTYSMQIKEYVEAKGGHCIVTGTDKYCKTGMSIGTAVDNVKDELRGIAQISNDLLVVVIDTCGNGRGGVSDIFGINFAGWKNVNFFPNLERRDMPGYLAWSLTNVLNRTQPGGNDIYYLNPVDAGVRTCVDVHNKKTKMLFGKNLGTFNAGMDRDSLLNSVSADTQRYAEMLEKHKKIDVEIGLLFDKLGLKL